MPSQSSKYLYAVSVIIMAVMPIGCSNVNTDDADNPDNHQIALMPNDLWVVDAESWNGIESTLKDTYIVYTPLAEGENDLKMFFDSSGILFMTEVMETPSKLHHLYFERGNLVFSRHFDEKDNKESLVAYANNKAYAAANKSQETWTAVDPDQHIMDPALFSKIKDRAAHYIKKEKSATAPVRIKNTSSELNGVFQNDGSIQYVMNVRKGAQIFINLESRENDVFFTVAPNNGSNMEMRNYRNKASVTGDLLITVFCSSPFKGKQFTLKVEDLSRQSQAYAQDQVGV